MYHFTFATVGGATRVRLQSGEDLLHLRELDQKMWTVLSCPTSGLEIADESLQLMDSNADGHLHINEVIEASEWLGAMVKNPNYLFECKPQIEFANIQDEAILKVAESLGGDVVTLDQLDATLSAITIEEQPMPEAPYAADVIAAYKEKKEAYAAYYQQEKLQKLGLATIPEETPVPGMKEKDFLAMGAAIDAFEAATAAAQAANEAALAEKKSVYMPLRKLLLLSRDFVLLLRNFVTLEDFYAHGKELAAIFQAGTLVIDQRACHLCVKVNDMAKQDAQAPASGMFLIYCNCTHHTLPPMQIVAALTMGEIKNVTIGKNAIFYDRQGNDYDATVTKVIDNPISIRQAFWSPYRKFGQWVTDLINKSAAEKNDKAFADMTAKAEAATTASPDGAAENPEKKSAFDIAKFAGIFAAIGMALGFIGSFLTSLAKGVAALSWWQILVAIAAILLVISGPAMIMAAIKLRRRNLAPILNANGWAVNADSIVNITFGATLTDQVQFPILKTKKKKSR